MLSKDKMTLFTLRTKDGIEIETSEVRCKLDAIIKRFPKKGYYVTKKRKYKIKI